MLHGGVSCPSQPDGSDGLEIVDRPDRRSPLYHPGCTLRKLTINLRDAVQSRTAIAFDRPNRLVLNSGAPDYDTKPAAQEENRNKQPSQRESQAIVPTTKAGLGLNGHVDLAAANP